jgi:hypothetical protein
MSTTQLSYFPLAVVAAAGIAAVFLLFTLGAESPTGNVPACIPDCIADVCGAPDGCGGYCHVQSCRRDEACVPYQERFLCKERE